MLIKNIDYKIFIKTLILWSLSFAVSLVIFAAGMYFLEGGYEYSPLIATVCLALSCLIASYYLGTKSGQKGILIGVVVAVIVFIIALLVSLTVNSGAVTLHTLLRFVILLLASMIGAVLGVNRKVHQDYI